ncbi:MAG: hypothetical protein ACI9XZ_003799 [Alphaproteobacteria bacterium]|jgi:hypothetical protein
MVRFLRELAMSAIFAASILTVSSANAQSLRQYMWEYRPLVIFAPTSNNEELIRQRSIVSRDLAGFRERNIVVIEVIASSVSSRMGPPPIVTANALRNYHGVTGRRFRAVLVGKDGGSKLESGRTIGTHRLFGIIDSMPMRQMEMRRGR